MFHVRVFLKSGAIAEFEATKLNAQSSHGQLEGLTYESPKDSDHPRLGWIDPNEVAAIVVRGSEGED